MYTLILIFLARWLVYVITVIVGLIGLRKWGLVSTIKIFVIALLAWDLGEILKFVFNTTRPFVALNKMTPLIIVDPSFPSTHTTLVASLGLLVFLKNKFLGVVILVLAIIIGWSRVLLNVHYPIDIVGGLILGVVVSFLLAKWLKV